jgi:HEAT repeat protein
MSETQEWDAFLCHTGEDHPIVHPLFDLLTKNHGLTVWCDEKNLVGGGLAQEIDIGLKGSRCGIVIVSSSFVSKPAESLAISEMWALRKKTEYTNEKVFFPVWFGLTEPQVFKFSHIIANFHALPLESKNGIPDVARQLAIRIKKSRPVEKTEIFGEIQQIEAVSKMGKDGFDVLVHLLDDPDIRKRVAAIKGLGQSRDIHALQPFFQVVRKIHAADVAQIIATRDHYVLLLTITDALTEMGKAATLELIHYLKDGYWLVRWVALSVLWKLGDSSAIVPVITLLEDKHLDVRRDAAYVLGDIGDPSAIEPLKRALKDNDHKIQTNAQEALDKISGRHPYQAYRADLISTRKGLYNEVVTEAAELVLRLHNLDIEISLHENDEIYSNSVPKLEKLEKIPLGFSAYEAILKLNPTSFYQLDDAGEIKSIYDDLNIDNDLLNKFRHTSYASASILSELDNLIEVFYNSIIRINNKIDKNEAVLLQINDGKYLERWRKLKKEFELWYKWKTFKQ